MKDQLAYAQLAAAEACLQIATAQPSRAIVDSGVAYVDQALALNPRLLEAQAVRAALLRLRAPQLPRGVTAAGGEGPHRRDQRDRVRPAAVLASALRGSNAP